MKKSYTVWICPQCGDSSQFAGFCDSCSVRLKPVSCVPLPSLMNAADSVDAPVAKEIVSRFIQTFVG